MDIAALSTAMANCNLAVQVDTSILSMNKAVMEQQGQALTTLLQSANASTANLEQSLTPHLGGTIDIKL